MSIVSASGGIFDKAIDTAIDYATKYDLETYHLQLSDSSSWLYLVLYNNVFAYQGSLYRQIRGLAMGSRLSGTLAIIVMDKFERAHIYDQLTPTSTVFVRNVDDTNTIANDEAEAKAMLTYLNSKNPTIKFELALPEENGYLPILDFKLKINVGGTKIITAVLYQTSLPKINTPLWIAPSIHNKEGSSIEWVTLCGSL